MCECDVLRELAEKQTVAMRELKAEVERLKKDKAIVEVTASVYKETIRKKEKIDKKYDEALIACVEALEFTCKRDCTPGRDVCKKCGIHKTIDKAKEVRV